MNCCFFVFIGFVDYKKNVGYHQTYKLDFETLKTGKIKLTNHKIDSENNEILKENYC